MLPGGGTFIFLLLKTFLISSARRFTLNAERKLPNGIETFNISFCEKFVSNINKMAFES